MRIEINYIWLGGSEMPRAQAENLIQMLMLHNEKSVFNIWVDNPATKKAIYSQLLSICHEKGIKKKATELLSKIKFEAISFLFTKYAPNEDSYGNIKKLVLKCFKYNLWSLAGDLLKPLILARPLEEGKPTARLYTEADIIMLPDFIKLLEKKARLILVQSSIHNEEGSTIKVNLSESIRADCIFVNLAKENDQSLQKAMITNTELLLSDPVISNLLDILFAYAKEQKGVSPNDVMGTIGNLVPAFLRLSLVDPEDKANYSGLPKECFLDVAGEGSSMIFPVANASSSWLPSKEPEEILNGALWALCTLRLYHLSDQTGEILPKFIHMFKDKFSLSCEDTYIAVSLAIIDKTMTTVKSEEVKLLLTKIHKQIEGENSITSKQDKNNKKIFKQ